MPLTPPERETIIIFSDADETAHISSWQRPIITKLRKNPAAVELRTHAHGSSVGAEFAFPKSLISFRSVKRQLTPEQREAATARIARLNAETHGQPGESAQGVPEAGDRPC